MRRRISALIALLFAATGLVALASPAQAYDLDCSDFSTQAQAQKYLTPGDPHRLDGSDNDGRACESLPCPCSYGKPKPNKGTSGGTSGKTIRQWARVTRVVDGDTVDVRLGSGARKRVRLLGIDTPERYTQCFGKLATTATQRLLPVGTRVRLTSDPSQARTDRYGRILRYVTKGKVDINKRLVASGAARVYVYNRKPFKRVKAYKSAQRSAKAHKWGMWRVCR